MSEDSAAPPAVVGLLADYPVVIPATVFWADMDAYGHVNNTVYLKWFESARIAYFETIGFSEHKADTGIGPILASTRCKFLLPMTYPDTAWVGGRAGDLEADRFVMHYAVATQRHERLAAVGEGLIVAYDYRRLEKAGLPVEIAEAITTLEGS